MTSVLAGHVTNVCLSPNLPHWYPRRWYWSSGSLATCPAPPQALWRPPSGWRCRSSAGGRQLRDKPLLRGDWRGCGPPRLLPLRPLRCAAGPVGVASPAAILRWCCWRMTSRRWWHTEKAVSITSIGHWPIYRILIHISICPRLVRN